MPTADPRRPSVDKIRDAVTELLDDRDPSEVTITDVVRLARVTRPTFYATFGDLPTAYADAAIARIAAALDGEAATDVPDDRRLAVMTDAITRMLTRIESHADFFRRVLTGHGGHLVQARIVEFLADEIANNTPISPLLAQGPLPIVAAAKAISAGVAWTMFDWFGAQPRPGIDDVVAVVRDFVYYSVVGGLGTAEVAPRKDPKGNQ